MKIKTIMAAARATLGRTPTDELEEGRNMCQTIYKKELTSMTVDDLYDLILHLATFGIWQVNPETGALSACGRAGGYGDVFKRLACPEQNEIHIVGFTNFVTGGEPKIFTDFTSLRRAIQKYYTAWRTWAAAKQKKVADYVDTYL